MNTKKITQYYILFLLLPIRVIHSNQQALVIVPVADLVGNPIKHSFPSLSIPEAYDQLPLSGGNTNPYHSCLRVHQVLLHETVDILEQVGDEVRIQIPNFFYITSDSKKPKNSYWTLKKNLLPLKKMNAADLKKIPTTPSFEKKIVEDKNSVILAMPYTDQITGHSYSAGTRFVLAKKESKQTEANNIIWVYAFDQNSRTFKRVSLPSHLIMRPIKNNEDKMTQFVNLIRRWTQINNGFIPYVWGGSSFINVSNGIYHETDLTIQSTKCSYFNLSDYKKNPKTGMDCSGIVGRAAQMCGIPYFFKNSATVATHLKSLQENQQLQEGDLIWIPGHIMIVGDLKKNTLLEARSSVHDGQGKIQEMDLDKVFKGISTYQQLVQYFRENRVMHRIGKSGRVIQTIPNFKLLKLASIWD